MFDMDIHSVILLDLVKDKTEGFYKFYNVYFDYMEKEVFKKYDEHFFLPKSIDELKAYIIKKEEKRVNE